MQSLSNFSYPGTFNPSAGPDQAPIVWTVADALRHFAPNSPLQHFGAKQLRSIQRPLVHLKFFRDGPFKAMASFPVSEDKEIDVGVKWTGEFVILTHTGVIDAYALPDWASLKTSMAVQARPLYTLDQRLLQRHLANYWAQTIENAERARRLKALLTCWREPGLHFITANILRVLQAQANIDVVKLLRSVGSRSAAVYNWLCVPLAVRTIRHTALKLEPALLAHAICHRNAHTDNLLKAVDQLEPLRRIIKQSFGLNNGHVRYLNRVVGAREVSAEVFGALTHQVAPLPPQIRANTYRAAFALALTYIHRMQEPMTFLFPARLCKALGAATELRHRQACQKTWRHYLSKHHHLTLKHGALRAPETDWLWSDDDDFEEEYDHPRPVQGWPLLEGDEASDLQITGLTSDDFFEEWLLGLPYEAMCSIHLTLCKLSLAKRTSYINHWRYALLVSLHRHSAMATAVPTLVSSITRANGYTILPGHAVQLINAEELEPWNDTDWQLTVMTCSDDFKLVAKRLENCVDDPSYLHRAMVLRALYVRLTNRQTSEETLIEFELTEFDNTSAPSCTTQGSGFSFAIRQHLGRDNRAASKVSKVRAAQLLAWLNTQFGFTPRGSALAVLRRAIKHAIARHLTVHRQEFIQATASRIHNQGLRWAPR